MTPRPRVVFVVAMAKDRTIAKDGDIPWHHSEDLRHFKRVTMGTMVVMGRRTLDSFGGTTLPGRENVVVTRTPADLARARPDVTAVGSVDEAIALAARKGVATVSVI